MAVVIIAPLSRIPVVSSGSVFVRSCYRVVLYRIPHPSRSAGEGGVGGYTCGTR